MHQDVHQLLLIHAFSLYLLVTGSESSTVLGQGCRGERDTDLVFKGAGPGRYGWPGREGNGVT